MIHPLKIKSGQGDYIVDFFDEISALVEELLLTPKAVVIIDRNVAGLYKSQLGSLLEQLPTLKLDANEEEKSLTTGVAKVSSWLQENGCSKQSNVVAIGGGIIQDIVTFSAHIYYRGIKWVFVPTTLLSMSDSCIGAKCGINLNAFKNQLGAFHSPSRVLISADFTNTLTDLDVASGYGEILKLMLTGSYEHFSQLGRTVSRSGLRNSELTDLIQESLLVKKRVIEEDEYERDLRRILNYGHTFGHSLESITNHEVPHGLAVAWGLDLVNFLSWKLGILEERYFQEIHEFVRKHLSFRLSAKIDSKILIEGAKRDKKASDGQVSLALLERPGALKIVKTPFDQKLDRLIAEYIDKYNVFDCP